MIVYKDIFTGDDIFSDAHRFTLIDDLYYEVYGKYTLTQCDVTEAALGGNRSAEEREEQSEKMEEEVIDFVAACNLQTCLNITQENYFSEHLKAYAKKLMAFYKDQDEEQEETVKDKLMKFSAILREKFKSDKFRFLQGDSSSYEVEGMIALVGHNDKDGKEPYMIVLKDGLKTEKM